MKSQYHDKSIIADYYNYYLKLAQDANFNMLRVWGGGYYLENEFYELCDHMGLLVWQEAMFGCAMYPVDEQFIDEIEGEISYQAQRLGKHPSIAVWGGNNEVQAAVLAQNELRSKMEWIKEKYE